MDKKLDNYLKLPYKLEIVPLSEEDGGGFYASYPELGEATAHGDGATVEEAVKMAEEAKRLVLEVKLEHGDTIPLPRSPQQFSGKFNVRVPKSLHRHLSELAQQEGVSLNQLIVTLLSVAAQSGSHGDFLRSRGASPYDGDTARTDGL